MNVLVSKLILQATPDTLRDLLGFKEFTEMASYGQELKKFRPTMRIQAFVDRQEK